MDNERKVCKELNTLIESYFAQKAQELKLKSGDISPEQTLTLQNAIEGIAKVVIQWENQNNGTVQFTLEK